MEHRADAQLIIADDHQLLAEACRSILEPQYKVVSRKPGRTGVLYWKPPSN